MLYYIYIIIYLYITVYIDNIVSPRWKLSVTFYDSSDSLRLFHYLPTWRGLGLVASFQWPPQYGPWGVVPECPVSKSLRSLAKLEKAQGSKDMSEKCAEIRERPQLKCNEKRCWHVLIVWMATVLRAQVWIYSHCCWHFHHSEPRKAKAELFAGPLAEPQRMHSFKAERILTSVQDLLANHTGHHITTAVRTGGVMKW